VGVKLRAGVLFTGGKDSVMALHKAVKSGLKPVVLLTAIPLYKYSMLYHQPIFTCLQLQAKALELPLETIGVYDPQRELTSLKFLMHRAKVRYRVEAIVTGSIKSKYQFRVFNDVALEEGLEIYAPLWMVDEENYLRELIKAGIKFMLISITSMGIPLSLLGKVVEEGDVERLITLSRKYGFNPSFEGGDAETLVVDAPLFKYILVPSGRVEVVSEFEGYYVVEKAKLLRKRSY
jgi:predicted ATP pyrophosphatase (TIGR00289 family)